MVFYTWIRAAVSACPEWCVWLAAFGIPLVWNAVCRFLHRKMFRAFAELWCVAVFALVTCGYDVQSGGLVGLVLAAFCLFLYRIPQSERKKKEKEKPPVPQKVCCYEPQESLLPRIDVGVRNLQDANLCLEHAFDIIGRLKLKNLIGSDRLEVDNMELTLRMYQAKGMLTQSELRTCNDALAVLLKLMSKYEIS